MSPSVLVVFFLKNVVLYCLSARSMDFEVFCVTPRGDAEATSKGICGPLAVRMMLSTNCLLCSSFSKRGVSKQTGSQHFTIRVADSPPVYCCVLCEK